MAAYTETVPVAETEAASSRSWWRRPCRVVAFESRPFDTSRQANWAFFPLHPLLWRAAQWLTGESVWSGLLLANLAFLGALGLLHLLAEQLGLGRAGADAAVLFAAFNPAGLFFVLPHTESLFLLLATGSFLAGYRRHWVWAAGLAMLAAATRFNGLFLLPALLLLFHRIEGPRQWQRALWLALIPLGLVAFMGHLWIETGNPLAFADIQVKWARELQPPWVAMNEWFRRPLLLATPWNPRFVHTLALVVTAFALWWCWKRRHLGLGLLTLLTVLAPLCTGTLMSVTRYVAILPATYLALGWLTQRSTAALLVAMATSVMLLALLTAAFAAGVNIGGA